MKYILINLLLVFMPYLSFSQNEQEACQSYYEKVLNLGINGEGTLVHSHKLIPRKIKKIFEKKIIKDKIDFTDLSQEHEYNFLSKKTKLIFLFCSMDNNGNVILGVYNREGIASSGFYFFFTIGDNQDILEYCAARISEKVCDLERLKTLLKNKYHLPRLSDEMLELIEQRNKGL